MRGAILLLAAALGLAGCLAPADDAAPAAVDERPPAESPSPAVQPASAASAAAPNASGLVTSFRWQSNASFAEAAFSATLHAPQETECEYSVAVGHDGPGVVGFAHLSSERFASGSGNTGPIVLAHAGPVSTKDSAGGMGGSGWFGSLALGEDAVEIVLAGQHLAPVDWDMTDEGSVLVEVECDAAFHVGDFHASGEAAPFALGFGDDGVAVDVVLVGGAAVTESVTREFASPRVIAWLTGWGGAGQLTLATPAGESSAVVAGPLAGEIAQEGGAGTYALRIDAYAGGLSAVYGAAVGLAPVSTWDALPPS